MTRPRLAFITGTLILIIASIAGCRLGFLAPASRTVAPSGGPAAPLSVAAEGSALYPLEIGNRWHYALVQDFHWTDVSGTPQSAHLESSLESELRCVTSNDSRSYTAQRTLEFGATATYTSWIYLRQDRFGLYQADIAAPPPCETAGPVSVSPARAGVLGAIAEPSRLPQDPVLAAARPKLEERLALVHYSLGLATPSRPRPRPAAGELIELAYPLTPGRAWAIRDDPAFTARVLGVELLRVPAGQFQAYRIRIDSIFFGPNDLVTVWYGREGFLKLEAHLEAAGTDESGNFLGIVKTDEREVLDELSLTTGALAD